MHLIDIPSFSQSDKLALKLHLLMNEI